MPDGGRCLPTTTRGSPSLVRGALASVGRILGCWAFPPHRPSTGGHEGTVLGSNPHGQVSITGTLAQEAQAGKDAIIFWNNR